jgi:hypothetical protein
MTIAISETPRYPLHRRLNGPQRRYGRGGKEKNSSPCRKSSPGRPAPSLVTTLSELLCPCTYYRCYHCHVFVQLSEHTRRINICTGRQNLRSSTFNSRQRLRENCRLYLLPPLTSSNTFISTITVLHPKCFRD